ncbi:MAG: tRNA pseudouridine(55) synthase TruB [Alphaproteobacteria bacterium]|nr:tRNA pseudouridine(55) synthase TruB [Alphaproteobacteria bacterium]
MVKIINQINGWLVIDKPYEMGSTTVVNRLKRYLHPSKIGHAGTLDPLATGVLPIALGQATKTIPYVMDGDKVYQFEVAWGKETSTDDLEGDVLYESEKRPSLEEIEAILPLFKGEILQTPPLYSAIKVNGKRAYELARKGIDVELKPRPVLIKDLKIVSYNKDKTLFEVHCGKGTYVRSLGHDMGRKLGCYGHVTVLRRTKCGPFSLNHSILLENLEKKEYNPKDLSIISVLTALDDILVLAVDGEGAKALRQGKALKANDVLKGQNISEQTVIALHLNQQVVALVRYEKGLLKPFRVFPEEV